MILRRYAVFEHTTMRAGVIAKPSNRLVGAAIFMVMGLQTFVRRNIGDDDGTNDYAYAPVRYAVFAGQVGSLVKR